MWEDEVNVWRLEKNAEPFCSCCSCPGQSRGHILGWVVMLDIERRSIFCYYFLPIYKNQVKKSNSAPSPHPKKTNYSGTSFFFLNFVSYLLSIFHLSNSLRPTYLNDTNFRFYVIVVYWHSGLLHHPLLDGIRDVGYHWRKVFFK